MNFKSSVLLVAACALLVGAYIIQKGDTLWDLSEEYLGDPFAWPDLWRANPYIEDPHWIYPGDSLCFPGDDPCPVAGGDSKSSRTAGKTRYKSQTSTTGNAQRHEYKEGKNEYRKIEQPKSFNTYYQRLMPILEPVSKDNKSFGWFPVYNDEGNRPIHHSLEHEVLLGFGKRLFSDLKVGDIAEIWSIEKVSVPNSKGTHDEYFMHRLSALARVNAIGDSLSRAVIVQSFNRVVIETARSRPQTPVETIEVKSFKAIDKANANDMAEVLLIMDKNIVPNLYSYILLNKGKSQNYVPGSAVAFWDMDKRDPTLPPKLLGRGMVVHSDNALSTVLIRDLYNATRRVDAGTPVSLTHQPVN